MWENFSKAENYVYEAFILCHFDSNKWYFIEIDFFDYINKRVLSQINDKDVLHLVAYFLRKIISAMCNYKIYNKKLLAIIQYFKEWRSEFKNNGLSV